MIEGECTIQYHPSRQPRHLPFPHSSNLSPDLKLKQSRLRIPTAYNPSRYNTNSLQNDKLKSLVVQNVSDWFKNRRHHYKVAFVLERS
jgi:hypothetical protein